MKKYLPQMLLITLAAALTACGGSRNSGEYPPKFIAHEDIPPLNVRKESVYTDNNQVNFPKYYPNNKREAEEHNKDVFPIIEPAEKVRR